uniref:NADH dehydrogenase subunit 6 n=1 Tax=Panagrolaimus sp. ES5 TaxID=591445 RepID=A0AC34G7H4_9BILA
MEMNAVTCATIVGVLGLISAIGTCFSCFFMPFNIPLAIMMLLTYIFVVAGIKNESPGYMLAAEVFLVYN